MSGPAINLAIENFLRLTAFLPIYSFLGKTVTADLIAARVTQVGRVSCRRETAWTGFTFIGTSIRQTRLVKLVYSITSWRGKAEGTTVRMARRFAVGGRRNDKFGIVGAVHDCAFTHRAQVLQTEGGKRSVIELG